MTRPTEADNLNRVAEMYDKIAELSQTMLGDNHHFGLFESSEPTGDLAEATDRMTDTLVDRLRLAAGERVLDLGCGTGRPALRIAERYPVEVTGITISPEQAEMARARADGGGDRPGRVEFVLADATAMSFPDACFDAVLAIESLEHMPDQAAVLSTISRLLKPGGRLVCAQPVTHRLPGDDAQRVAHIDENYGLPVQPFFDAYPGLIAAAGLRLTRMEDIVERVMPPTMAVVDRWMAANGALLAPLGDYRDEVEQLVGGMREITALPSTGYAVIEAVKP
jgi:avermectin B 5-O-methyltransferase